MHFCDVYYRHPNASSRPSFENLRSCLEDTSSIASQAGSLGTGQIDSCPLFPELQMRYQ